MRHAKLFFPALLSFTLALLAGTVTCRPAAAQVELDITREATPPIPIGLVLPVGRDEFSRVMEQDLSWSGFFLPQVISSEESDRWPIFLVCQDTETPGDVAVKLFSGGPGALAFHRIFSVTPRNERHLAHTVAKAVIEEITGQSAITLSRIVAARVEGGNKEIVLLDYDGGGSTTLTRDGSLNRHPRFSPDGKSIIYTSFLNYWPAVFLQEISSGRRRVIASYPGLNTAAVFHPAGGEIALSLSFEGNPGDIYLLETGTGALKRLTQSSSSDTSPVFLPGGRDIVLVSDRSGRPHLYRLNIADGNLRRLTFESNYNTSPSVSPDGRFVAYTALTSGQMEIRLIELGSGRDFLLTGGPGRKEDPAFAPNSRHLVYVHTLRRQSNLKIIDIFTRKEYNVTVGGGFSTPDWH